ncbi:MAG: 50S ribosomal protein L10 [Gammaproteobacteria bacterium]
MALNLDAKKAIVSQVADVASSAISLVAANYRGLSVSEMTDLRTKAREANVYLRVVRNTLAKRAVENTEFECVRDRFTGPLVLAFSQKEPSAAARVVRDFAKDHEALEVRFLSISGQCLEANELNTLAKLPTREEAISQLLSVMQAPVSKLVRTMAEPHAKFVRTLAAVKDQKQAASN